MIPFDAGAIGGKCRTNAEFYSIYYKQSDFGCQVFCARVPGGAKGFKFVYANLLFWCAASRFAKPRNFLKKVLIVAVGRCSLRWADSRFAKPRNFPKKVLIVAVRSCRCGVLNRGLQNLESAHHSRSFLPQQLKPFKESLPDKKHVPETNIRDVPKGERYAIRVVLWTANRPKPFRCRFKVMLFHCRPWR